MLHFSDFPGGPALKMLHFHLEGPGPIPGQETKRSHVLHGMTRQGERKCDVLTPFTPFSHPSSPPSLAATNLIPVSCLFLILESTCKRFQAVFL